MKKNRRIQSFALLILAAVLLAVIGARKFLAGSCHQDGFYEKKSGTVYTISFWNGLDGT